MQYIVAIVGRPNVGKSTLFNRLTRSRDALVADSPGLTRDRKFGIGRVGASGYTVIDTGGVFEDESPLAGDIHRQAMRAVAEADCVLFVVDAGTEPTGADLRLAEALRPWRERTLLIVNKVDDRDPDLACASFHALGFGAPIPISARHGGGITALGELLAERMPGELEADDDAETDAVKVAIVGRPNVGKSTLVNRMLGEERVITADLPGTTRDSIAIPFKRDGREYLLIDTAGIRRRGRIHETAEKFSVVAALQAIDRANVVILLLDGREGITEQDAGLLGLVLDSGRALVIAVNKWDGLSPAEKNQIKSELERRLHFIDFAETRYISALHGSGVGNLFAAVDAADRSARIAVPTSRVSELLARAIAEHQPPLVQGRRIKLRYAHLGGRNPPTIVIHGNQTESVPAAYRRYLEGYFRRALRLVGTPVRIEFRQGENPYAGRRNELTPRQINRRRRLMRHVKRNDR
ncbi:MAG: ribosome biogenesis GTPase Der [Gammaproteobacteria bacterium]|nr:ribosome biogenesis GTPase Der [Gammaproteobacteria bacterium]